MKIILIFVTFCLLSSVKSTSQNCDLSDYDQSILETLVIDNHCADVDSILPYFDNTVSNGVFFVVPADLDNDQFLETSYFYDCNYNLVSSCTDDGGYSSNCTPALPFNQGDNFFLSQFNWVTCPNLFDKEWIVELVNSEYCAFDLGFGIEVQFNIDIVTGEEYYLFFPGLTGGYDLYQEINPSTGQFITNCVPSTGVMDICNPNFNIENLESQDVMIFDCSGCIHPDYNALMELYISTNGDNWTKNDGWSEGAEGVSCDPCNFNNGTWYGITCENDRVVCIDLDGVIDCEYSNIQPNYFNNIQGNISRVDFTTLSNLKVLSILNANFISNNIPESIGSLMNLEVLAMPNSFLSGSLPAAFSQLEILNEIHLNDNNLSDCYPSFICNISIFNTDNNPLLPWQGNHIPFCNGEDQIGSPCDDGDVSTENDVIQQNCSCRGESQDCVHPDYSALMELYNSTDGNNWTNTVNRDMPWDRSCNPCDGSWFGVACENNRVITIDLDGNVDNNFQLFNGINPFGGNNLFGSLPNSITTLSELKILSLSGDSISGSIPISIGSLEKLEVLNLGDCRFTGTLPTSLYDLENIESLMLVNNNLRGNPEGVTNLSSLTGLWLSMNEFEGEILTNICNLTQLTELELVENNFSGGIPGCLGDISSLIDLYLANNNFSGCFPEEIIDSYCNSRYDLFSSINNPSLPNLGNIDPLCSGQTQVGAPCEDLDSSTEDDVIEDDCSCTGASQDCIHPDYNALIELYDSTNGDNWTNTVNGDRAWDQSCDPCDGSWFGIECQNGRVTCIDLDGDPNCTLDVIGNNLDGTIPDIILEELEILILSGNKRIVGELPQFDSLENVQVLRCDNCSLSSSLPNFNLPSLRVLSISNNNLSGQLPEMNLLPNVEFIRLNENAFEGTIPEFVSNPLLNRIRLQDNNLSGCYPSTICNISDISYINNPLLPWEGDHMPFCSGEVEIGAPCDDGITTTTNETINDDCECLDNNIGIPFLCTNTPVECDLNSLNFSGTNPIPGAGTGAGGDVCNGAGVIQNALWYGIQAQATEMEIDVVVNSCTQGPGAPCPDLGAQIAVWGPGCPADGGTCIGGSADCTATGATYTVSGLIVGQNYYVLIDGCCESICDFGISVTASEWEPDFAPPNELIAAFNSCTSPFPENVFCLGAPVTINVDDPDLQNLAADWIWSIFGPAGVDYVSGNFSGGGSNFQVGDIANGDPGFSEIEMVFSTPGTYTLCLDDIITNCDSGNGPTCLNVEIVNLIEQDFGEWGVCESSFMEPGYSFLPPSITVDGSEFEWNFGRAIVPGDLPSPSGGLIEITTIDDCGCEYAQFITINIVGLSPVDVLELEIFDCQLPYTYDVNGQTITIDDADLFNNFEVQLSGGSEAQNYFGANCDSLIRINASKILLTDSLAVDVVSGEADVLVNIYRVDGEAFSLLDGEYIWRDVITNDVVAMGNPVRLPEGNYLCEYNGMILDITTGEESPCFGVLGPYEIIIETPDCLFDLQHDFIETQFNTPTQVNVLTNDIYPSASVFTVTEYDPTLIEFADIGEVGFLDFTVIGNFSDTIDVTYEVCDSICLECQTAKLFVTNEDLNALTLTNVISPNNDGLNDILRFSTDPVLIDSKLTIFNRWGNIVHLQEEYDNSWSAEGLPGGIYFYVLEVFGLEIKRTITVFK